MAEEPDALERPSYCALYVRLRTVEFCEATSLNAPRWRIRTVKQALRSLVEFWTRMTPGRPVILVVEDEFLVRMLAVAVAQDSGFDVLSAGTADEAIEILESRSDIRLVFTDVNMPGSMDGLRLAHAVRNRWPPVELIVTSGHSHIRKDELPERGRFFAKPYDIHALSQAFQEMAGGT